MLLLTGAISLFTFIMGYYVGTYQQNQIEIQEITKNLKPSNINPSAPVMDPELHPIYSEY